MGLGLQGNTNGRVAVYRLVEAAGASGAAAPTLPTDGLDLAAVATGFPFEDVAAICIRKAAGTSVSVASARVGGYRNDGTLPGWGALGWGADAVRGLLNGGGAIGEVTGYTAAGAVLLWEEVDGLHYIDRIAAELGAITGTGASVDVDLILRRRVR